MIGRETIQVINYFFPYSFVHPNYFNEKNSFAFFCDRRILVTENYGAAIKSESHFDVRDEQRRRSDGQDD